jgi:hypothetical protein
MLNEIGIFGLKICHLATLEHSATLSSLCSAQPKNRVKKIEQHMEKEVQSTKLATGF